MWSIPVLLALAGVLVPILLFEVGLVEKRLAYKLSPAADIRPPAVATLSDLNITLGNRTLENVGITTIQVINNGNAAILRNDFEQALAIEVEKETEILRTSVIERSPTYLNVEISQEANSVLIQPLLLNQNDSFTVQLVTTGPVSKPLLKPRIAGIQQAEEISDFLPRPQEILWPELIIGLSLTLVYFSLAGLYLGYRKYLPTRNFATSFMNHAPQLLMIIIVGSAVAALLNRALPFNSSFYWVSGSLMFIIGIFVFYISFKRTRFFLIGLTKQSQTQTANNQLIES